MLDQVSDIENGRDELDNAIDTGGEETFTVTDADDLKDSRGEVLVPVSSGWEVLCDGRLR